MISVTEGQIGPDAAGPRPLALIGGVAEGLGVSLARTFGEAGYDVVGVARSERVKMQLSGLLGRAGAAYAHVSCDITDAATVAARLAPLASRVAVMVHNAHELLIKPFEETTCEDFERVWRVACLGAATIWRLAADTSLPAEEVAGGEEIFVLDGLLTDELGTYGPRTWIRNPDGFRRALSSRSGATFWAKRGHLSSPCPGGSAP